ncbi:MAG: pyruvate formate lyase family protein, partial [bacterium]
ARYYTESWRQTEGSGLSNGVRVALAMKHVYENMNHYVNPEDKIAGYWTESFLGIPIIIERGEYNKVLQNELDRNSMRSFRVKSFANTFAYLLGQRHFGDFVRNIKMTKEAGPQALNIGIETMTERDINRYSITSADRVELKKKLLPYWNGKTIADRLEKEIYKSELLKGDMRQFAMAIPANTSRQIMMLSTCSNIATIQGHVIIDYEKVIRVGLLAMKEEVEEKIKSAENLTDDEREFFESVKISIEGTIVFAERLVEKLEAALASENDPEKKENLCRVLENCRAVPLKPAETFHQAVQSAWTIKTAVELALPTNLHCFGRMDQIFNPYYEKDIEEGRITRGEAREILSELLLKTMSQNIRPESNILSNFYHRYLGSSPITIGGLKPDGTDGTNELTYLFLEAANESRAVTNVSLRVHKNTPEDLMMKLADILNEGSSNISIFNDDVNVEAMERRGFAEPDARDYAIMGCVEMLCPGKTSGMSASSLLLSRLLDITLRNGDSQTLMGKLKNVGLKTGDPDSFDSFEQLVDAFIEQAKQQVRLIVEAANAHDRLYEEILPAPYASAFIDGCMEKRKDVTAGGARYDITGVSFINSIANVVDSLYVMKKLIFERKEFNFKQLLKAIDKNFIGYEDLHRKIRAIEGKWGNGHDETDELARHISTRLFEETYKYKNYRGGPVVPYVISMTTHTIDGRISIASPDGRRAAMPYAASCNPYNVERNGVTGAMKSVAAIDFKHVLGCAVNMKFHPSAIGKTDEAKRKWISLLR